MTQSGVLFNHPMSSDHSAPSASDYRLSPVLGARFVGGLLVAVAVLLVVATVVVAVLGLSADLIVLVAVLGVLAALVAGYVVTRRVTVVHLGTEGYRVRLVRGTGVVEASWRDVEEAVTAGPGAVPVVVLRLRDGRTTTIPVHVLAADREEFVRDLLAHLRHGQGLRPL